MSDQSIIVNTKWDKAHCRFGSVNEMVEHYIATGVANNARHVLQDVVQCNSVYRDFLRANGYPSTVNRLLEEAPALRQVKDAFEWLDRWWDGVEKRGGLGGYDIRCCGIDDTVTLFGEELKGLQEIRDIVQISEGEKYLSRSGEGSPDVLPDSRKDRQSELFAAELWYAYPTFDSYDSVDDRFYSCFFIRNHPLAGDFWNGLRPGVSYTCISEDRLPSELPLIYHDGESPVMYVIGETAL